MLAVFFIICYNVPKVKSAGLQAGAKSGFWRKKMTFLLVLIYLSFISLGLPDSLLGSAWPVMYADFSAPISFAGAIAMTVSVGTVVSSFWSSRLISWFGTAKVTAVSVAMTGLSLIGFSFAGQIWLLFLFAVPLGFGAGSVDAALNNFVALHYKAKHMNWLHCFWGIGATAGPVVMAFWISAGSWRGGYGTVALIQCLLAAVLFATLPAWKKVSSLPGGAEEKPFRHIPANQILQIPLAKPMFVSLFCYCAVETTVGLWSASFSSVLYGVSQKIAASYAAAFYFGITAGRAAAGFLSVKWGNFQMIRLGQALIGAGLLFLLVPVGLWRIPVGLVLIGLGCAPIYPAMLHQTPKTFGEENSQAMMGIQMASAYIGSSLMPPVFGFLSSFFSMRLFPFFVAVALLLMTFCTEIVRRRTAT